MSRAVGWVRKPSGLLWASGVRIRGEVFADGELWISRVWVDNEEVDRGEWDGKSAALKAAENAMVRAIWLRRFDTEVPKMKGLRDEDEDDETNYH